MELEQLINEWQLEPLQPARNAQKEKKNVSPLIVSESGSKGSKFTPHPEGAFPAILLDIHDVGMVYNKAWDKNEHKADFYFFCGEYKEGKDGERFPLLVRDRYTLSLGEKSRLRKFLESWRGKKLTPDELKKLDLETLLGKPALLQITHNVSGDNTYANITSIMALPKGMTAPEKPEG
jgi:hypothetical protein